MYSIEVTVHACGDHMIALYWTANEEAMESSAQITSATITLLPPYSFR